MTSILLVDFICMYVYIYINGMILGKIELAMHSCPTHSSMTLGNRGKK